MPAPADPVTRPRRFERSINVAQLVFAFAAGQGSLFLAQTWLVHSGQLALLGRFGALSAFAMLGMLVVDINSLTSLARRVAATASARDRAAHIWAAYSPVTVVRLVAALIVVALAVAYAIVEDDAFSSGYVIAVLPAFVIWAFNGAGLLDGLQRSGISGIALALPYIASAAMLPFAGGLAPAAAGVALGAAQSIGFAAAVAVHIVTLRHIGFGFRFVRPTVQSITAAGREGLAMTVQWLPSQLFYRFEILMCGYFLGAPMVGLFVYAKQVTNAAGQLVSFLRRVEFPALVRRLSENPENRVGTTFLRLGWAVAGAAVASIGVAIVALLIGPLLGERLAHAGSIIATFSPVVFTAALSATLTLGLFALGKLGAAAKIANISIACGVIIAFALVPALSLTGFVIAEIIMNAVGVCLAFFALKRSGVAQGAAPHDAFAAGEPVA